MFGRVFVKNLEIFPLEPKICFFFKIIHFRLVLFQAHIYSFMEKKKLAYNANNENFYLTCSLSNHVRQGLEPLPLYL